jgi:hypothetical protein
MVRTAASNYVAAQPQIKKVTQILNQIAFRGNACFDAPPIPVLVIRNGYTERSPQADASCLLKADLRVLSGRDVYGAGPGPGR